MTFNVDTEHIKRRDRRDILLKQCIRVKKIKCQFNNKKLNHKILMIIFSVNYNRILNISDH